MSVVVSRIQNRRGTQTQFEALYPAAYTSTASGSSVGLTVTVADTTGLYVGAKPSVIAGSGKFAPGTVVDSVISSTQFTVNIPPSVVLAGAVVRVPKYTGTGSYPLTSYPNVLLEGEVALCTDSKRMFMGSANGEYIEIAAAFTDGIALSPLTLTLLPTPTPAPVPQLSYFASPFFTILYSLTDSASPDWGQVGTDYSKNGVLKITATEDFTPVVNAPYPDITPVNIIDEGIEVSRLSGSVSFFATYSGTNIEVSYINTYPVPLTFSSSTISWLPF